MVTSLTGFQPFGLSFVGYLKDTVIRKNLHTIQESKTLTTLETEAILTEIRTKVLNNFILRLHKVRGLWGRHMEHVLL
jgi:hypothetical protein